MATQKPKIPPDDRTRAPSAEEWPHVWDALETVPKTWLVAKPIHAAVSNWRAWVLMVSIVTFFQGTDIIETIRLFVQGE